MPCTTICIRTVTQINFYQASCNHLTQSIAACFWHIQYSKNWGGGRMFLLLIDSKKYIQESRDERMWMYLASKISLLLGMEPIHVYFCIGFRDQIHRFQHREVSLMLWVLRTWAVLRGRSPKRNCQWVRELHQERDDGDSVGIPQGWKHVARVLHGWTQWLRNSSGDVNKMQKWRCNLLLLLCLQWQQRIYQQLLVNLIIMAM